MNQQTIQDAINALTNGMDTSVPTVSIPAFNYSAPQLSDVSSQYQQFLNDAASNPDLINYYNGLLEQAKGDTQIAISQLENDYQTGVRNISQNLTANLAQLGLTFTGEQESLQNTLNQRGIALTNTGGEGSPLTYDQAGGESGFEQSQLAQSQQLRQEAEQRTAQQNTTSLLNTEQSGITARGQGLTQAAQQMHGQFESDVTSMANQNMNMYTEEQNAKAQQALMQQAIASKSGAGGLASGDPKNMTQDQRQQLWVAYGHGGTAPVGYGGG